MFKAYILCILRSLWGMSSDYTTSRFSVFLPLRIQNLQAHVAQSVEHFLGKEEVTGSNPVVGSITSRIRLLSQNLRQCPYQVPNPYMLWRGFAPPSRPIGVGIFVGIIATRRTGNARSRTINNISSHRTRALGRMNGLIESKIIWCPV